MDLDTYGATISVTVEEKRAGLYCPVCGDAFYNIEFDERHSVWMITGGEAKRDHITQLIVHAELCSRPTEDLEPPRGPMYTNAPLKPLVLKSDQLYREDLVEPEAVKKKRRPKIWSSRSDADVDMDE